MFASKAEERRAEFLKKAKFLTIEEFTDKWIFVGICRCPMNNPVEHATHTKENCPLHGGGK